MKRLALIALLISGPAMAQDQSAYMAKALGVLEQQRNSAANDAVNAQARLGVAQDEIAALRKEIDALRGRIGELESKREAKP